MDDNDDNIIEEPDFFEIPEINPGEKKDFKIQANYTLRELEAENSTLTSFKDRINQQMTVLQIEETLIRRSLDILENPEISFDEATERIEKLKENLFKQ